MHTEHRAHRCWLWALPVLAVLPGCGLLQRTPAPPSADTAVPAPPRDLDAIPDAVPRDEPRSRYGNPETYEVFGKRYKVMKSGKGHVERGLASWYGPGFHSERTSSGEPYDMYAMTAAHKTLPIPAYVRVTNLENGRSVVVRVNDRGPFVGERIIDLSYTAASKLDMLRAGTARVEIRVLDARSNTSSQSIALTPPTQLPTGTPTGTATGGRFLQVGSFGSSANASALVGRLTAAGISGASVREARVGDRLLYRVRVGPVVDAGQAARLTEQLRDAGVPDARLAPE
jgi:rare lipoprotein A